MAVVAPSARKRNLGDGFQLGELQMKHVVQVGRGKGWGCQGGRLVWSAPYLFVSLSAALLPAAHAEHAGPRLQDVKSTAELCMTVNQLLSYTLLLCLSTTLHGFPPFRSLATWGSTTCAP